MIEQPAQARSFRSLQVLRPSRAWRAGPVTPLTGQTPRWFDDRILDGLRADGIAQLVLCGAGLNTCAIRLPSPHAVTVFTVDQPAVLALVDKVIANTTGTGRHERCRSRRHQRQLGRRADQAGV
ncbi:MAG: class I SAM-dependent methyltransferase [Sciscionella sp.]